MRKQEGREDFEREVGEHSALNSTTSREQSRPGAIPADSPSRVTTGGIMKYRRLSLYGSET